MADDHDTNHLTAEQYRERAKLVRYTAESVRSALLRQDLLDVAAEYDQLADSTVGETVR
jgi:hypothetical protein